MLLRFKTTIRPWAKLKLMASILVAAIVGGLLGAVLLPYFASGLSSSLFGPAPKAFWYLSRTSALAAYVLLWISMLLGISITSKLARLWPGGPTAFELHQHTGLLGLLLAAFHALILLGDQYIGYSLAQIVVPFGAAPYRPVWVGLGQVGMYLTIVVTASFYLRRQLGRRTWRLMHGLSFLMFVMVLAHGVLSGTDTSTLWIRAMYWISGATVLWGTVYRVLSTRIPAQPRPGRGPVNAKQGGPAHDGPAAAGAR